MVGVLVMGAVHPRGGPEAKMRGLAAGFERMGCTADTLLVAPGRKAVAQLSAGLARLPQRPDVVVARSHWTLPPLLPALRRWQRLGTRLVIDSPTPTSAGMHEIAGSDRSLPDRVLRTCVEAVWIPTSWPAADLVTQYDADGWPWRGLARHQRLTLTNGIDVETRPLAPGWVRRASLHFVTAGAMGQWHGIDRLMHGMAADPRGTSTLAVVGDGPELGRLRGLAVDAGLSDRIRFTGVLTGRAYDAELAAADVGVASLGEHRRGGFSLSPLKTRDYLARGLPVLFAGDDPDLRTDPPFTWRCSDDDSPVDIPAVRTWLASARRRDSARPAAIRAFALAFLDHEQRAQRILDALGLVTASLGVSPAPLRIPPAQDEKRAEIRVGA